MAKTTNDLFSELNNIISIKKFTEDNSAELSHPDALEYFLQLLSLRKISKSDLIKNSGLERTYAYHILSGKKNFTRDKIIIFSIAANFSLSEVQNLLKYAKEAALYPRDRRDSIIIYALNSKLSLMETNEILENNSLYILE